MVNNYRSQFSRTGRSYCCTMKADTNISRELREKLENASNDLHALTVIEGHKVTDGHGGMDEVWMELHHREFDVSPTLAHILTDQHTLHYRPENRPRE